MSTAKNALLDTYFSSDHDGHCHCGLGRRPCDCDPEQSMPAEACTELGVEPARVPINRARTVTPLAWFCIGYFAVLLGSIVLLHAISRAAAP